MKKNPLIASFFSYKGGAGRTTSALNTTYYLVNEVIRPTPKQPLLIIDADTESAGISYLLLKGREQFMDSATSLQGLCAQYIKTTKSEAAMFEADANAVDPTLLSAYSSIKDKFIDVSEEFGYDFKESVLLLRANVDSTTLLGDDGGLTPEQFVNPFVELIKTAREVWKCPVIIDTPSGTQQLTKAALDKSNTIVCHMRPTAQFQEGTKEFFNNTMYGYHQRVDIVLCPSVVPLTTSPMQFDDVVYPDKYHQELAAFISAMKILAEENDDVNVVDLMTRSTPVEFYLPDYTRDLSEYHTKDIVGIPEIDRFKWREGILPTVQRKTPEEELACERYNYLANIIAEYQNK